MQEDFFYEFPGFWNIKSRCHLRILAEPTKPVVVICSQPPDNPGTSVQNAYAIIREQVNKYLSDKTAEGRKKLAADSLDEFANTIEKTKKFDIALVVFLLRQVVGVLKNEKSMIDLLKKEKQKVIWLEHWPEGTGLLPTQSTYFLVSENQTGSPGWGKVNISELAEQLGYAASQLFIPLSTFAKTE